MTYFLVETEYFEDTSVQFFEDHDELATFLRTNFEQHHYSGDGLTIKHLFEYVLGEARLRELVIHHVSREADDNDYVTYTKAVHEKADAEGFGFLPENKVFEYTIRIDGRA